MRTLDEVIESCERVAQSAREKAKSIKPDETNIPMINDIFELADEQEQLARWLKELKRLTMRRCDNCKNYDIHTSDEMPCCKCSQLFKDYFEAKEDAK